MCILFCGDIPSIWPRAFSALRPVVLSSHYTSLFLSLSNLKTLWVKGNRNRGRPQSFYGQHSSRMRTVDPPKDAPIKTAFVHHAQCGTSGPRRDSELLFETKSCDESLRHASWRLRQLPNDWIKLIRWWKGKTWWGGKVLLGQLKSLLVHIGFDSHQIFILVFF